MARGGEVPATCGLNGRGTNLSPVPKVFRAPTNSKAEGGYVSSILLDRTADQDRCHGANAPVPDFVSNATLSAIKTVLETVLEWFRKSGIFRSEALLLRLSRQVLRAKCSSDIVYVVRQIREFEASIVSFCNVWHEAKYGKQLFADNIPVSICDLKKRGFAISEEEYPIRLQHAIEAAALSSDARETCREAYAIEWWADHGEPVVVEFSDHWASTIYEETGLEYKGWPPFTTPATSSQSESSDKGEEANNSDSSRSETKVSSREKRKVSESNSRRTGDTSTKSDTGVTPVQSANNSETRDVKTPEVSTGVSGQVGGINIPDSHNQPREGWYDPNTTFGTGFLSRNGGAYAENLNEIFSKSPALFPEWVQKGPKKGEPTKASLNINSPEANNVFKPIKVSKSTGTKPKLYLREGKEEKVGPFLNAKSCSQQQEWAWKQLSGCGTSTVTSATEYVHRSEQCGGELEVENSKEGNLCKGTSWESLCNSCWDLLLRIFEECVGLEDRVDSSYDYPMRQCVEGLVAPELPTVYQLACSGEYPVCREESCGITDLVNKVSAKIVSVEEDAPEVRGTKLISKGLGIEAELATSGDLPSCSAGGLQTSNVAPKSRRQRRNRKSRASGRRDADSSSSSEADVTVHKQVSRPTNNVEECGAKGDVRKRGSKETKSLASRKDKSDRGGNNDRDDSNKARVGRAEDVHSTQKPNMENVQLHEGRENGMVGRGRSVQTTEIATTEMGGNTAGVLTCEQRSVDNKSENRSTLQDANGHANSGKLQAEQAQPDETRMASTNLATSNPQRLCSQRGEESSGSSSDELLGAGTSSHGANVRSDRSNGKVDAATSPLRRFGGVDMLFSSAEEEVISETGSFTFRRTIRIQGRDYQVFCKVREVENSRKRRRPKNDPSKNTKIQSDVRDVHEGDRAQSLPPNGSVSGETRNPTPNGSERPKSVSESPKPAHNVGADGEPSSDKSGFKQVGPARKRGHAQTNAPIVSKSDAGPSVEAPVATTTGKQSNNPKRGKIQNKGRRHEWRYDDSSGQLHCRDCNTAGITRFANRLCYGARLNYIRRFHDSDSDLSPSSRVVRYKSGGQKPSDQQTVNPVLRRRGRSRDAGRKAVSASNVGCSATVVEVDGPRVESGRISRGVSPNPVLSTQTSSDSDRLGDDAGSKQSIGYGVFRDLPISEKSKKLLGNALDGSLSAPSGDSDSGTPVSQTGETAGSSGKTEGGGIQTHTKGSRDEHKLRKTYARAAKAPTNNSGAKNNGNGTVEFKPRPTGETGGNGDRNAQPKKTPEKVRVEGRKPRDYANIRFIEGDIFSPRTYAVAHCVGADFRMGAGVAKGFAAKFGRPKVDKEKAVCGSVHLQEVKDVLGSLTMLHMVTKPLSSVPAVKEPKSYIHLERCLKIVAKHVKESMGRSKIAIPNLIGCGLDGMDRSRVLSILQRVGNHYNVNWIVHKNPTPRA